MQQWTFVTYQVAQFSPITHHVTHVQLSSWCDSQRLTIYRNDNNNRSRSLKTPDIDLLQHNNSKNIAYDTTRTTVNVERNVYVYMWFISHDMQRTHTYMYTITQENNECQQADSKSDPVVKVES